MDPIAKRLRKYADRIDNGSMKPSKMFLLFDEPNIVAVQGFTDLARLNALTDKIAPIWCEGIKEQEPAT